MADDKKQEELENTIKKPVVDRQQAITALVKRDVYDRMNNPLPDDYEFYLDIMEQTVEEQLHADLDALMREHDKDADVADELVKSIFFIMNDACEDVEVMNAFFGPGEDIEYAYFYNGDEEDE